MKRPWYRRLEILIPIIAAILGAIIGPIIWTQCFGTPDFNISVDPIEGKTQQGGVISTAITVKSINGYEYSVSLSASNQPSGIIVTFVPPFGGPTPSYTSTVTINVNLDVSPDSYEITINGLGADGIEHRCKYVLNVMPSNKETTAPTEATTTLTEETTPPTTVVETTQETTALTEATTTLTGKTAVDEYFYPSGWMGDSEQGKEYISFTRSEEYIKVTYTPGPASWAGIYWLYPDGNWGEKPGRNLTGVNKLAFLAKGETGTEIVEFKTGGIKGKKYEDSHGKSLGRIKLSQSWEKYEIDLTSQNLSSVIGAFAWIASQEDNPDGLTFYLKEIYFE